jgi:CII-binding regulator of phage lambda lysogenization HflD
MDDGEKQELIAALKKKWEAKHREYQTLTHKNNLDTLSLKNKYEECERVLNQLEKDIQMLSKNFIFVDTTQPSTFF